MNTTETQTKRCHRCGEDKPLDQFYKGTGRGGVGNRCRPCGAAYERERHRQDPRRHKSSMLKFRYGITIEDYERMLCEQGGVCAACKQPETVREGGRLRSLAVDHDHKTGKVRGLLCLSCNRAIGLVRDEPDRLQGLLQYLAKSQMI